MASRTLTPHAAVRLAQLGRRGASLSDVEAAEAIGLFPTFFGDLLDEAGYATKPAKALRTKFRDAGRRSAPWKPASSKVPGRPQDGADGNRINRWLLLPTHKYYADERTATLVEIRYYLQVLSMDGAPPVSDELQESWEWLTGHPVRPGEYHDPIQLTPIDFAEVVDDPRMITSGHLVPLDRGGKHTPENTFLILQRSNQMQGNMTLSELLTLADEIVTRHRANGTFPVAPEMPPKEIVQ